MAETALITGASTGIGYELCKQFAAGGFDLILVARNQERLEAVAAEIRSAHDRNVEVMVSDLSVPGAAVELHDEVVKRGFAVDALVNNAGYGLNGPFAENDFDSESGMVQLNVAALLELTHLFVQRMIERRRGYILNVASTAGFQPGPLMSNYYATKSYVILFTEGLYEELKGSGVRVSALCPGATRTEFFDRANMNDVRLQKGGLIPVHTAEKVARAGFRGVLKGKVIVIPGIINKIMAWSVGFTPRWLIRKIAHYINSST